MKRQSSRRKVSTSPATGSRGGGGGSHAPRTSLQRARAKSQRRSADWDRRRRGPAAAKAGDGPVADARRCRKKFELCLRKAGCGRYAQLPLAGAAAEIAQHLKFTNRELNEFQLAFDSIDLDDTKEIDYDEFLEMLEEPRSPYTDALFALVDDDAKGVMDVERFFRVLTMYSMYTREEIHEFVFQTFDKDASGQIDEDEFLDLARTVSNAEPLFPGNFKTALEQFDQNDDGMLNFREFSLISSQFPMVFYPAFRLQDKFHEVVLGRRFWQAVMVYLNDQKVESAYMMTHDGHRPRVSCFEQFQRKLFCLFECCRGPRWRAAFDPTFGADYGRTAAADGQAVVLRKRRKKGQNTRSQRSVDRRSPKSAWGGSASPDAAEPSPSASVSPVNSKTKRERNLIIAQQRITVKASDRRRAW